MHPCSYSRISFFFATVREGTLVIAKGTGGRRGRGDQGYPWIGRVKGEGGLGGKGVRLPMAGSCRG